MKRVLTSGIILMSLTMGWVAALPGRAAAAVDQDCNKSSSFLGLPAWYKYLDVGNKEIKDEKGEVINTDKCAIKGPLENPDDPESKFDWQAAVPLVTLAIVEILLRISGLVAIGFIVFGGVRFITSQGEPDAAKTARGTVINALIGLVIAVSATALVGFIGRTITG